ncbi:MAG: MucB/RseB C-terminal domain-containing protein [Gammaproteobacteria bacterium]|nr:MucB/RseB C-terminal domain-containing protein [Gammaproteobacteria bacterium]
MFRTLQALLLALLAGSAVAESVPQPRELLDAMSRNFRALDYRGVFTYEQGQTLRSVRIVHVVVDGVEQERLLTLDGEQREFLRRDHPVDCLHAGDQLLRLGSPPLTPPLRLDAGDTSRLDQYYAIEFDGTERVASRSGSRLRISPRDPYRYGMTLVLDDKTSLLLKSEITDGSGRVLERFQFVDVEIGKPVSAADLDAETPEATENLTHAPGTEPQAQPFVWTVSWLPEGFALSARELRAAADLGREVETQMYTDGLAVFAVFVERGVEVASDEGEQASQGATVAYVIARGGQNVVTVVGEIPIATAQLVANAVNFPDDVP